MDPLTSASQAYWAAMQKQHAATSLELQLAGIWVSSAVIHGLLFLPLGEKAHQLFFAIVLAIASCALWIYNVKASITLMSVLITSSLMETPALTCAIAELASLGLMVLVLQCEDLSSYLLGLMWPFVILWSIFVVVVIVFLDVARTSDLESRIIADAGEMEFDQTHAETSANREERKARDCVCDEGECEPQNLMHERGGKVEVVFDGARERGQREGDEVQDLEEAEDDALESDKKHESASSDESDSDRGFVKVEEHKHR
ncbi:hypothetical protein BKA65DRAFT_569533 [Rhexocercosporidium sp. MPI-PUGE-AT-0058]|nr:hypothetical protein BKA65DRAFT_569533 [Rhexocercosporidium sp. MPI-PUGE-AT-0058]